VEKGIKVLQPSNLKAPSFLQELKELDASLFIVVAFRMLPELVWAMPKLGTFNLHASLLPQYRGAAPINRVIMNGERIGGLTTFFLRHEIDTGNIIFRQETAIGDEETAGEYHDRLKQLGAKLVLKTVDALATGNVREQKQEDLLGVDEELKLAPKIYKEDCRIDWTRSARETYNLIRGLSPSPGAFTEIVLPNGKKLFLKIFRAEIKSCSCDHHPGSIITDNKNYFYVCCRDACISVLEIQQAGKKRMKVRDFLVGLNTSALK
jgi:methionyl-tRNA formyltransferase